MEWVDLNSKAVTDYTRSKWFSFVYENLKIRIYMDDVRKLKKS